MRTNEILKNNLQLILGLGALALIRPVMKITGAVEWMGSEQFGSILLTILISLAWLIIVVVKKVSHPVAVLVYAGLSYALFAIILSGILSPILDGKLQGPLTNPMAIVGVLATNAIWGLMIGGAAVLLKRVRF
jgi:hypothetical protein